MRASISTKSGAQPRLRISDAVTGRGVTGLCPPIFFRRPFCRNVESQIDDEPEWLTGFKIYEEELDLRDACRWSPDGKRIAFWHFDSSGVGEHPLIDYTGSVYPSIRMIPYPKAGNDKLSCQHRCGRCPFGQIEMDGHSG